MGYVMVITTTDDPSVAERMAKSLVERGLAACVQVLPKITSFYEWKGKLERASEYLLFVKTKAELYDRVEKAIMELHNYEVPEIVAFEVARGLDAYLAWIDEACRS